ncbi:hypothetical protein ANN_09222 [Periplaneta americana]|uniref:Uncharacterized protein n=1 Tax=Periplaneta americana TaxID=6978 RepID=A0ABQ8TKV4_PERAM|nr:hypothetical protein ANN_09222 [Periplaneta americana]
MGNACYYSVEKLLLSSLLSKNLKVRIYKTLMLPVVLYDCETWTFTLREEQRLRVFENKVLRKIFGAKRDEVAGEWRKLHNVELHALYSSPDIIRNIKSRRLRWAGHVTRMDESRNAYRVLVGRPEGKSPLGRPRLRWEDNIKMDLMEVGYDDSDWINLAQDREQWRAYVRVAMNLRLLKSQSMTFVPRKESILSRLRTSHNLEDDDDDDDDDDYYYYYYIIIIIINSLCNLFSTQLVRQIYCISPSQSYVPLTELVGETSTFSWIGMKDEDGNWNYNITECEQEFFSQFPDYIITEYFRRNVINLVDKFRATKCTERKKSVRWPTKVTEDAVKDVKLEKGCSEVLISQSRS